MSDVIVIGFDIAPDAFAMRAALAELQTQSLIEIEDAVVVTRDDRGNVHLHQATNLAPTGSIDCGFWGMLLGNNRAALFLLVRKIASLNVFDQLRAFAGKARVLQTSLSKNKEEGLRVFLKGARAE